VCHLVVCIAHCNVHVVHEVSTLCRRRSNSLLALALRLAAQLLPGFGVGVVEVQRLLVHWNKFSKVSALVYFPYKDTQELCLLRICTFSGLHARQRLFEATFQRLHRLFHLLDLGLELAQNCRGNHRVRIVEHVQGRRRKTLIQKENYHVLI